MPKPGIYTTEFWITLLTNVVGVIALLHPGFNVSAAQQIIPAAAAAFTTVTYTISRMFVKSTVIKAAAGNHK